MNQLFVSNVCLCVYVRERERERERDFVYVSMYVSEREKTNGPTNNKSLCVSI